MEKRTIVTNENLTQTLKELKEMGYNYIVKAQDKTLSGWGQAENRKHIQLIACKTPQERATIYSDLESDRTMNYLNWCRIDDYTSIYNYTRNKSFTLRNDWTRCF